uniref:Uncharacterized protein n=1 Tax=Micrurus surinamensis TaxID=129470 RepID=A0A2D4NT12_MICSU
MWIAINQFQKISHLNLVSLAWNVGKCLCFLTSKWILLVSSSAMPKRREYLSCRPPFHSVLFRKAHGCFAPGKKMDHLPCSFVPTVDVIVMPSFLSSKANPVGSSGPS